MLFLLKKILKTKCKQGSTLEVEDKTVDKNQFSLITKQEVHLFLKIRKLIKLLLNHLYKITPHSKKLRI